ncbi:hypothetical protein CH330_03905 [candidate division WOR-3 bacterium JGI_Cruoil_03_51_56]|uniref:Outer membrane protein beta-barrel domain-containing protein n=1 Tax=candidate division WOR-3 bacterium JGI_Cruoil_03_51_56 TaxID=1973747 RepID=A0A235BWV8_UNCW3|nr:MAG: hypothetical protein CH330_03905 [candidate division WOR-3 bacterium JGI_Cruoil_03_51_56]
MVSVFRRAVSSPLLLCVLAASVWADSSERNPDFGMTPGSRFGTVGLDVHYSSGDYFSKDHSMPGVEWLPIDPVFRAGVIVGSRYAVGAELALLKFLPKREPDPFSGIYTWPFLTYAPVICFGPSLAYFQPAWGSYQPFGTVSISMSYGAFDYYENLVGWRAKLTAGVLKQFSPTIGLGLELGCYHDRVRIKWYESEELRSGNSLYLGLQLTGFQEP